MISEKWLLSDNISELDYQEGLKEILIDVNSEEEALPTSEILKTIVLCIDLTTLEGSDTTAKVQKLCEKAKQHQTAAVCLYPPFVEQAKQSLENSSVKVACVAGGFPSGQLPLDLKLAEIKYAIHHGADEIDTVISRGKLIEKQDDEVMKELKAIHKIIKGKALWKVILETGELSSFELIRKASEMAVAAGADFIKTSTGKIKVGATEQAVVLMCLVIRDLYLRTGKKVGIKVAGGVSDVKTAVQYVKIVNYILGEEWLNKHLFRIGASRLLNEILNDLNENQNVG